MRRTASNQLPVYLVTKAGGTKQQTKIQKAEGDLEALQRDLTLYLDSRSSKSSEVTVHPLNGHVIVKVCSAPIPCFGDATGWLTNFLFFAGLAET